jgi:hypothetical protein
MVTAIWDEAAGDIIMAGAAGAAIIVAIIITTGNPPVESKEAGLAAGFLFETQRRAWSVQDFTAPAVSPATM